MESLKFLSEIKDGVIDMILCDLPYGSTQCSWDTIIPLDKLWEQYERVIKEKGVIVLTATQPFASKIVMSNINMFKYCWYWDRGNKSNFLNAKHQPMRHIEGIYVFYNGKSTYNPILRNKRKDQIRYNNIKASNKKPKTTGELKGMVGRFDNRDIPLDKNYPIEYLKFSLPSANKGRLHPTEKPVSLFKYLIKTYSNEGDLVLDNCIGSGTTAVACKQINRNYIGCDINQEYVDIANERLRQNILSKFKV